jgi:hypothetical protein
VLFRYATEQAMKMEISTSVQSDDIPEGHGLLAFRPDHWQQSQGLHDLAALI